MEPVDPRDLRISDADRHRVAEFLRDAAGEGRIDMEELDQRLEATYAARTYGDLVPLTVDLPDHRDPTPGAGLAPRPATPPQRTWPAQPLPTPTWGTSLAIMSESKRTGVWVVGEKHTATALMGSVVLDLREAQFGAREITIYANAVMGAVQILVDFSTVVDVSGIGVMGAYMEHESSHPTRFDASSPVVHVKGLALMGSVEVRRKESEPDRRRRKLGGS